MTDFSWTDEACEDLRKLWAQGWSASEVAKVLGAQSRNAVIGKVHRLGLELRGQRPGSGRHPNPDDRARILKVRKATVERVTNHGNRFDRVVVNKPAELPAPDVEDELIPLAQRVTSVLALKECHCRWPVGDPGTPGFFYCGHPSADMTKKRPYCAPHAKRAKGKPHRYDGERRSQFRYFNSATG